MENRFIKLFVLNFALLFLGVFCFVFVGTLVVPNLVEVYSEFGAELPFFTKIYINVIDIFLKSWFLLIPFLFVLISGVAVVIAFILRTFNDKKSVIWNIALFLLSSGLIVAFIAYSVYLPMFTLSGEVSELHEKEPSDSEDLLQCLEIDSTLITKTLEIENKEGELVHQSSMGEVEASYNMDIVPEELQGYWIMDSVSDELTSMSGENITDISEYEKLIFYFDPKPENSRIYLFEDEHYIEHGSLYFTNEDDLNYSFIFVGNFHLSIDLQIRKTEVDDRSFVAHFSHAGSGVVYSQGNVEFVSYCR